MKYQVRKGVYIFWFIWIFIACLRVVQSVYVEAREQHKSCLGQIVSGYGYISNEPTTKESGQTFVVDAINMQTAGGVMCEDINRIKVKVPIFPEFSFGDYVSVSGRVSKPANFGGADGREFDYEGFLAKDDIYYEIKSAKVAMDTNVELEDGKSAGYFMDIMFTEPRKWIRELESWLFDIKRRFVDTLSKSLGEPHSALAAGLVVGEKAALGKDLLEDFRTVGLVHIIVLSGFNITIVGDALRRLFSFLPRIWGIVVGGMSIVLFGMMVGGGATVFRSCVMAVIALCAGMARKDYSVSRALIFAGLIMVSLNPKILAYDPSFQLSFLATAGLVLLAGPIESKLGWVTERFGMRGIVASTLATQIFVTPFILHMMGQISVIGMLANILVLPFVPLTMLVVFLTGSFGLIFQPFSLLCGWISHVLLSYELFVVESLAKAPYASLYVPQFSFWWVVGFYVGFVIVLILFNRCKKPSKKKLVEIYK